MSGGWGAVHGTFWSNKKVLHLRSLGASREAYALALWVKAFSFCQAHVETYGHGVIPASVLPLLGSTKKAADDLLAAGLWVLKSEGEYAFNAWEEWQKGAADIQSKRAAAGRKSGAVRRAKANKKEQVFEQTRTCVEHTDTTQTQHNTDTTQRATPGGVRGVTVRAGFSERFLAARGLPWASARHEQDSDALASWLDRAEGVTLDQLLDGFFADSWVQEKGYPFGALATDPAKYAVPPKSDPAAEAAARTAKQRAQIARIDAELGFGGEK